MEPAAVFERMLCQGCTDAFPVASSHQVESSWRTSHTSGVVDRQSLGAMRRSYALTLVQYCDIPSCESPTSVTPATNLNTHFPPSLTAARSLFAAILKAYPTAAIQAPHAGIGTDERVEPWILTRVIAPAIGGPDAHVRVFGFKLLGLLAKDLPAESNHSRAEASVAPVTLEYVLSSASAGCRSDMHLVRCAAVMLYGQVHSKSWQNASISEVCAAVGDALRLSKDAVGSVREGALRVIGVMIANGVLSRPSSEADSGAVETRLRSLETHVLCVLTDGLRDSKLSVSVIFMLIM